MPDKTVQKEALLIDLIINTIGARILLYITIGLMVITAGLAVTVKIQSARLDTAQAQQESLGDKLTEQNRAVLKWKTEADKQTQSARSAAMAAEKVRTITVERVRTVTVAAIPTACPAALKWGAEYAGEFNKRWEK